MKGKFLSSVAGVVLTSALGVGAPAQAQAQVPTWTGSYVGGSIGWAWGYSHATTNANCNVAPFFGLIFCDNTSMTNGLAVDASGTGWMDGSGPSMGFQGGYNWQLGNYVYGLETDFGGFFLTGSRQGSGTYPVDGNFVSAGDSYAIGTTFHTDWLYTLRGRFGWTTEKWWHENDRLWLYVTGGFALTDLKVSFNFSDIDGNTGNGSNTRIMPGWALGAGLEYMLDRRWSLKAEYLHVDFGNVCVNGSITEVFGYSQGISTCADLNADLVRFGINYKL